MFFLNDDIVFPPVHLAGDHGLLAIGGDLSVARLTHAYEMGIFPWFNEGEPIVWYSPNPRMVLFPDKLKISKSMRRLLRTHTYKLTQNQAFDQVIVNCKTIERKDQEDTWITDEMVMSYVQLFRSGIAKSFEVWENDQLVGGLYGIELNGVFCGESMFAKKSNTSKLAFMDMVAYYKRKNFRLIDCQVYNDHLSSLGAEEISRDEFLKILKESNGH
ncbi:leucyl/phenylalanyl-tRNA--protein transferase [Flavobacteriaceae bacterium]|nr:leucyl/phenylalanyl-tRNA--protein transferase [Flavobacteriaceae bacterium]